MTEKQLQYPPVPKDDTQRALAIARPDEDQSLPHLGIGANTYTVVLSGTDTNGHFCVIDMLMPPGGGTPPHRHDFEETFIMVQGELEMTFRGQKATVNAGCTLNIPSNAPHEFHNVSGRDARLFCICSPAGQEDFFKLVGVRLPTRATSAPLLSKDEQAELMSKGRSLAAEYKTEFLGQS